MRQEVDELWNCSIDPDRMYRLNSLSSTKESTTEMDTPQHLSRSSLASSVFSELEQSPVSVQDNQNPSNNPDCNFFKIQLEISPSPRRKISDSSDASSYDSASISPYQSTNSLVFVDLTPSPVTQGKFDDIIEKIVELKFSGNKSNDKDQDPKVNDNYNSETSNDDKDNINNKKNDNKSNNDKEAKDLNANYKEKLNDNNDDEEEEKDEKETSDTDDEDDGLIARGPIKPKTSRNNLSHTFDDWLENAAGMSSYTSNIDSTAQQILSNQYFRNVIDPCLDRLENSAGEKDYSRNYENGWNTINNHNIMNNAQNLNEINNQIPSITFTKNSLTSEELVKMINMKQFQGAQPDNINLSSSRMSENWPDSPASYNVLSSRSHSRASSRAQSPGFANTGSPAVPLNISGSPPELLQRPTNFRVPTALSSSSSSSYSFGDTPSPSNYQYSVEPKIEEQLGVEFVDFSCCNGCESLGGMTNPSENSIDFDNNLQMVEEIIGNNLEWNEIQVIPNQFVQQNNKTSLGHFHGINKLSDKQSSENRENNQENSPTNIVDLGNTASLISSAHNDLVYPDINDSYKISDYQNNSQSNFFNTNSLNPSGNEINFEHEIDNLLSTSYNDNSVGNQYYFNEPQASNSANNYLSNYNNFSQVHQTSEQQINNRHDPSTSTVQQEYFNNSWNTIQNVPFDDFQIPETVSSFKRNTTVKRSSNRHIAPWPSLNLPFTQASRRLKDGLDPKDVEKAMKNLLKKSPQELAAADEDGDTMLMCLVGNPIELEKKKAYLIPLVERLGIYNDALSRINNRGEDALYLAAMNCPQMGEVAGYLGAVMLQKGIDISQRLYQTRGDTLIHAVVANGDTHVSVLAELLALKTAQRNSVFDLSKCNYDGRTPLHVAVEAHDPHGSGINAIGTIRLLLDNGADPRIKEIKCGNTPLHLAVSLSCDPALVKGLLARNGHEAVNIQNRSKNTPLHMAAAVSDRIPLERQMEVCAALINAGGLTNILNQHGKTPLALVSIERKEYIRNIFRKKF
ncbi:probable cyclin-dependent serine/threonine-protein kinase DDB_G0292550 [Chelonus insularis]|uniref:probable cyclin-dependent serine/threonine-protein kinase DDB_G0292550 n=1 Tax=Chelonus insularis TaxID=460826 RepID=UPI00158C67A2|nr:probable cyclin-dependent serine/threonine-protein kinase DDB_G0292550 [Chelonus insularis]